MNWQLFTALSIITYSASVILRRLLLRDDKSDPFAFAIVFQSIVGIFTLFYALFTGFDLHNFTKLWFAILLTCILYALGNVYLAKALAVVEASVYSILGTSSVIFTIIFGSWILHDKLSPIQIVGIILVLSSILILNIKKGSLKLNQGLYISLISASLFGLAVVGWTYVARRMDVPTWAAISFLVPALMLLIVKPKAVIKMKSFKKVQMLIPMMLLALVYTVSSISSLYAYKEGNLNLVISLQQSSTILVTVFGILFLHEHNHLLRKIFAAIICVLGAFLIVG